jgi:hypothetical protein
MTVLGLLIVGYGVALGLHQKARLRSNTLPCIINLQHDRQCSGFKVYFAFGIEGQENNDFLLRKATL